MRDSRTASAPDRSCDVGTLGRMTRPSQWYETPDLHGEHVTLTQLHPRHAAGVLAASDDDSVFEWLSFHRPTSVAAGRTTVETLMAQQQFITWAQIDRASGEVAGTTSYYDINPALRTVAIGGTWLGKRFQRTGVNTDAKLLLLRRAFDDLGAVRVVWHTDIYNEQSQAALTRLGATREGVLRKHKIRKDGSWRDTVQFSMTDDDWPDVRAILSARLGLT